MSNTRPTGHPKMSSVGHKSFYSNIDVIIMANRPLFNRNSGFGDGALFGELPIANRPILGHLLAQFKQLDFPNVLLVCEAKDQGAYVDWLAQFTDPVTVFGIDGSVTTADVLRKRATEGHHVLLCPIDLLTSVDLTTIVDFHIASQARLTAVVTDAPPDPKTFQYSPVCQSPECGKRYLVYDERDRTKLVTLLSDLDAVTLDADKWASDEDDDDHDGLAHTYDNEDEMSINPKYLTEFRTLVVDNTAQLTGMFLISPRVVEMLKKTKHQDVHSIESDLIPMLCLKEVERKKAPAQYCDDTGADEDEEPPKKADVKKFANCRGVSLYRIGGRDFAFRVADYATVHVVNMRCARRDLGPFLPGGQFVATKGDLGYFIEGQTNAEFEYTPNSVYGGGLMVGKNVKISRSVIGRHCKIGDNVKLENTVLFDHVQIEEGCVLKNCVVGSDARIQPNCQLIQSFVVPKGATKAGEICERMVVCPRPIDS